MLPLDAPPPPSPSSSPAPPRTPAESLPSALQAASLPSPRQLSVSRALLLPSVSFPQSEESGLDIVMTNYRQVRISLFPGFSQTPSPRFLVPCI